MAVHDGARPALALADLVAVCQAALSADGAVLGRGASDTLKLLEQGVIVGTVDRTRVFRAETPQVFRRELLERAIEAALAVGFSGTDEASLVERLPGVRDPRRRGRRAQSQAHDSRRSAAGARAARRLRSSTDVRETRR